MEPVAPRRDLPPRASTDPAKVARHATFVGRDAARDRGDATAVDRRPVGRGARSERDARRIRPAIAPHRRQCTFDRRWSVEMHRSFGEMRRRTSVDAEPDGRGCGGGARGCDGGPTEMLRRSAMLIRRCEGTERRTSSRDARSSAMAGRCGAMRCRTLSSIFRRTAAICRRYRGERAVSSPRRIARSGHTFDGALVEDAAHPAAHATDDLLPPTVIGKGSVYPTSKYRRRSSEGSTTTLGGASHPSLRSTLHREDPTDPVGDASGQYGDPANNRWRCGESPPRIVEFKAGGRRSTARHSSALLAA